MLIATWNVNSVKAHLEAVTSWLKEANPDVLCLQEIKCEDAAFPSAAFEELGYNCAVHGQKTYNGVALLSKFPLENITRGLAGDPADEQARYIEATVLGDGAPVIVGCLYLPNGNPVPGPKYDYKLGWMKRLRARARELLLYEEAFVLAGDYNIIPAAGDARNPKNWVGDALYLPQSRAAFESLKALGLTEAYRALHPHKSDAYSFWDYQAGAWPKNNGIRIDHLLLSPQAADRLAQAEIHPHVRGWDKPSDHVPVSLTLK
jgi:exodeoxyribonuclease III